MNWCRKKTNQKRYLAAAISACCIGMQLLAPMQVQAAAQNVLSDETMYVNLTHSGAIDKVNVVKGLTFNNASDYTDYGNYTKVQNMSTDDAPELGEGKVTWKAPVGKNKLFFEGTMDPTQVSLPWDFNVTYKLNGVVTDPEQLAGASGLIEMDIDAYPNANVNSYMQNNMILLTAVPVDMSENYSVEAPGAQTQTLGEQTMVVFMAMPGEEQHFVVRIGTDSFETIGAIMVMVPATFDSLSDLSDLNEAKNTFRDDMNNAFDDVQSMLGNVTDMQSQLDLMDSTLRSLENAKKKIQTAEDSIFGGMDVSIEDLQELSNDMKPLSDFIKTAQWLTYDLNTTLNETNQDALELSNRLNKVSKSLRRLGTSFDNSDVDTSELQTDLQGILSLLSKFEGGISGQKEKLDQYIAQIEAQISQLPENEQGALQKQVLGALLKQLLSMKDTVEALEQKLQSVGGGISGVGEAASSLSGKLNSLTDDGASATFNLAAMTNDARDLIGDMDTLNTVLNSYYPDIQAALSDSNALLEQLSSASNNLAGLMSTINETMKSIQPDLDAAADTGLEAGKQAVSNTRKILDTTESMKNTTRGMQDTINNELDKTEDDSNILNLDPTAPKVSLTSEQNEEPNSIQIVCRTDEISIDDDEDELLDAEQAETDNLGALGRIVNVFKKLFEAIVGVFKDIN